MTLTWSEMLQAANVGIMRQVQNMQRGRKDRYGCSPEDGWTPHIEGACGEMAVAKALGLYWSGAIGNLRAGDVGDIQVRTSTRQDARLILHESDPDDKCFVLVTGVSPELHIVGWILGKDGKAREYWSDPAGGRPAYFVPQSKLRPIDELKAAIRC